jgi:predicted RNase H-like nuclease (RuvC/YqgF family)
MDPQITTTKPPALEPNKLKEAYEDYQHMANEVAHLNSQVEECSDLNTKLVAENDALKNQIREQAAFYARTIEVANQRNARLNALSQGLITRLKAVKECIEAAEVESHMESARTAPVLNAAPVEDEEISEDELLSSLGLDDPERRPADRRLPTNTL